MGLLDPTRVSDSEGLGWELIICTPHSFPGEAAVAGRKAAFSGPVGSIFSLKFCDSVPDFPRF